MPILVDSYHLIQFVLQSAANNTDGDWQAFIKQLVKIYRGHIPDKVLHGLIRHDVPGLTVLCQEQIVKNHWKKEDNSVKLQQWMQRREKGNREAWTRFLDKKKENQKKMEEDQRKVWDDYVAKMKPVWEEDTKAIINRRLQEIKSIWAPPKNL
jgi:hypothetical protein